MQQQQQPIKGKSKNYGQPYVLKDGSCNIRPTGIEGKVAVLAKRYSDGEPLWVKGENGYVPSDYICGSEHVERVLGDTADANEAARSLPGFDDRGRDARAVRNAEQRERRRLDVLNKRENENEC